MKSAIVRILIASLTSTVLLFTSISQVQAHCHALNDSTGDSGSSFGFTDIVSTELSNNGSSIGVKITTAGNIPNGFGTTGQIIFGVMFPASLLSQDSNDTGINFITVHWKEDGTGWEGSQFIYREKLESKPWNASIQIDGKTATFSVPKELIGKGDLAYLVSIGLVSEDTTSNDYAPNNFFSDCYVIAQTPSPQAVVSEQEKPPSPQIIAEAPTKEGNKFIEKPGVNRITKKDPGQSLVLSTTPAFTNTPQTNQSPKPETEIIQDAKSLKPPAVLVGLIIIALLGILAIGAVNILPNEGAKTQNDCEIIRLRIKHAKNLCENTQKHVNDRKEKIKKLKEKAQKSGSKEDLQELAENEERLKVLEAELEACKKHIEELQKDLAECEKKQKAASGLASNPGAGTIPKQEGENKSGCKQGDLRVVGSKSRKYHFLDPNREIYIETDHKMPDSGDDGKNLAKIFKGLKLLAKGAAMVGSGHPASIPVSAIAALLGMAGDVAETLPKIKGKFKVLYLEIPMVSQTYICEKQEICAGNKWVPRTDIIPKLPQVPYEKRIDFPPIMVEDIPSFIKKLMRDGEINDPNQVDPCKESAE